MYRNILLITSNYFKPYETKKRTSRYIYIVTALNCKLKVYKLFFWYYKDNKLLQIDPENQ